MNKKRMNAMLGSLTALCMTCTTMSNAIVFAQDNTFEVINENANVLNEADPNKIFEGKEEALTVFYNGEYFNNTPENGCDGALEKALIAAFKDQTTTGVKEIHCRPGKDVGKMTHGHVADDLIIHGNGAYVSSGERDLEVDTYKFSRTTGAEDNANGQYLEKDITVTVNDLDGVAAWGERHTTHNITLNFNNCKNMQRVYVSQREVIDKVGDVNINLTNCSFVGDPLDQDGKNYPNANLGTTIYSNYNGTINVEGCEFKNIDVAFNMNHKVEGEQTVNIKDTEFTDCGLATKNGTETYAAPIRIVAKKGATSNLSVENCEITYSEGKSNCGNGDILLGDGRHDASQTQGTVTLTMSDTKADVMAQKAGYYQTGGKTNPDNATTTTVQENEVVDKQEVTADKEVATKPAPTSGSGGGATVQLNPVYRAYNPNNGEHLYTLDEKEYKHVASVGWDAEGVAFMAEEEKNGQALYRVYNPNSGLHHYTLDEKEKNTLVSLGWHDEKVAWYTSKKPQSAPVFRVYNPNDGNHHYTMNKQEKDFLVSFGWQDEGLAFRTAPIEK